MIEMFHIQFEMFSYVLMLGTGVWRTEAPDSSEYLANITNV